MKDNVKKPANCFGISITQHKTKCVILTSKSDAPLEIVQLHR